jgi:hypothetical protein
MCVVAFAASHSHAASRQQEAQFLAGCEVLAGAVSAAPAVRAAAFRWLMRQTGITAAGAVSMVESYRDRPDEWRRMLDTVRGCLDDVQATGVRHAAPDKR